MRQVLVVLGQSATITVRDISRREPIRDRAPQLFGDRVLIAQLSSVECELVSAIPGVVGVFAEAVPADLDLPDDLTGRTAVQAWNARAEADAAGGKRRIGDGLAWDDPSFEPEGRPGDYEGRDG